MCVADPSRVLNYNLCSAAALEMIQRNQRFQKVFMHSVFIQNSLPNFTIHYAFNAICHFINTAFPKHALGISENASES